VKPARGFLARALPTILVVAALSRFGFSAWVVGLDAMTKGDEADYHAIATHLAAGDGFVSVEGTPTARRPPVYPLFLSLVYRAPGPDAVAGRLAQVVLGVMVVWLTMRVTRAWFTEAASVWAGWFAALNPFLVFLSGYLLTENLYLIFVLGALTLVPAPGDLATKSWRRAALAGFLLGCAALTRPSGLPMLDWTLATVLLFSAAPWKRRAMRVAVALVVFLLVLAPWLARNARTVGGAVLTTHGGITFYQGNNAAVANTPQWRGGAAPLDALEGYEQIAGLPELERDRAAGQLGRAYLRAHPGDVPSLVAWKLVRFWRVKSDMGLSGIRSGWWFNNRSTLGRAASRIDVGMLYAVVLLPLFVMGLCLTWRRWRELLLAYGVVVVHTAVAVIFFGSLRTRIPVEPVMCAFAAAAVVSLFARHRRGAAVV
jgi:4-amino-4-deoxy-L-arabinose transferase-like glycosyltransferase